MDIDREIDAWSKVKKTTNKRTNLPGIRTGEIRWCRLGINIGKEQIGKGETFKRPVLILKKFSGDVFFGLPLTSKAHTGDWYFELTQKERYGYIILNQGRVLDRKRLEDKIVELGEKEVDNIKRAYCRLIMSP
jgi:mRNA-degrading endonuclease toxin of MazEF toxin-antitoxin module